MLVHTGEDQTLMHTWLKFKLDVHLSQCFDSSLFVVGTGLDSNVVARYWLDAARHQPERNDTVSSLWSVAVHFHPAGNPDHPCV